MEINNTPTKTFTNEAEGLAALIFDDGFGAGANRYRVVCRDVDAGETFVVITCASGLKAEEYAADFVNCDGAHGGV